MGHIQEIDQIREVAEHERVLDPTLDRLVHRYTARKALGSDDFDARAVCSGCGRDRDHCCC